MSKGYPDYFGQSVWPKYGDLIAATGGFHVHNNETTIMLAYTGQGVLSYLQIGITDIAMNDAVTISVEIDGDILFQQSLMGFRVDGPHSGSVSPLTCYSVNMNPTFNTYELETGREMPFLHSIRVIAVTGAAAHASYAIRSGIYCVI